MSQANNVGIHTSKINASGQLDATTGLTGAVPVANGGTGTTSTTFVNAATNVTGTLPVANGGTGLTTVGTNGQVLSSNGSAAVWATPSSGGGGVTSLNGQTGAIDNTTQYAIGSYVLGRPQNGTDYNNSTVAGSSLTAAGADIHWYRNPENAVGSWDGSGFTLVNTGSWRCVSIASKSRGDGADYVMNSGLWIRYA